MILWCKVKLKNYISHPCKPVLLPMAEILCDLGSGKLWTLLNFFLPIFRDKQVSHNGYQSASCKYQLNMHRATLIICTLRCLVHFLISAPFPARARGLCPSLPSAPTVLSKESFVAEAPARKSSGKAQGSQALPPPSEIMAHVQTTGMPEMRGRDK